MSATRCVRVGTTSFRGCRLLRPSPGPMSARNERPPAGARRRRRPLAVRHPSFLDAETSATEVEARPAAAGRTCDEAPDVRDQPDAPALIRRASRDRADADIERSCPRRWTDRAAWPVPSRGERAVKLQADRANRGLKSANGSVYAVGKVRCRRWSAVGSGAATGWIATRRGSWESMAGDSARPRCEAMAAAGRLKGPQPGRRGRRLIR